jgi:5'-deoxynucleotidase YfbR-like HD superfamily hydrolase
VRDTGDGVEARQGDTVAPLVPLLAEMGDLKRLRTTDDEGSLAERAFRRSWSAIVAGEPLAQVARRETSAAVSAARLGGIDARVLRRSGLDDEQAASIFRRSFDSVAGALPGPLGKSLREGLGFPQGASGEDAPAGLPSFVGALVRQPRAGATAPGKPRIMLEPPESHAEHCATVAFYGVLLSDHFGAEPAEVFLAGLAHHFHNAILPDAGFAGEELLGDNLGPIFEKLNHEAISELPEGVRGEVRDALRLVGHAESPGARAFNAADVLDRVLQMRHHARAAAFTLDQALDDLDLVHEGPLKGFHEGVLREAGLR